MGILSLSLLLQKSNTGLNLAMQATVHWAKLIDHRLKDHRRLNKPYFIQPPANLPQTVYRQRALCFLGLCVSMAALLHTTSHPPPVPRKTGLLWQPVFVLQAIYMDAWWFIFALHKQGSMYVSLGF